MNPAVGRARQCARFYRGLGYNALPGRARVKGPALQSFEEYWERMVPEGVLADWTAANVQLMTGARWKLCVVDCDGDQAHDQWHWCKDRNGQGCPLPTWVVRSGGGGWHYYFTLPAWLPECPSRLLWGLWDPWGGSQHRGGWVKHREVRLLADRALVIAPPSIHVETGCAYEFLEGHSPREFPRPMDAPGWLLRLPRVVPPPAPAEPAPYRPATAAPGAPGRPPGPSRSRDEVMASIPDKIALAASWGLRIAGQGPNPKGWIECHSILREDRNPSAGFNPATGVYHEPGEDLSLSLLDLAVRLGAYPDWLAALHDLGGRFTNTNGLTHTHTHAHDAPAGAGAHATHAGAHDAPAHAGAPAHAQRMHPLRIAQRPAAQRLGVSNLPPSAPLN